MLLILEKKNSGSDELYPAIICSDRCVCVCVFVCVGVGVGVGVCVYVHVCVLFMQTCPQPGFNKFFILFVCIVL